MTKAFKKHSIWHEAKLIGIKSKPRTYEQRGKNNRYNRYYTWLFNNGKTKQERIRITSDGRMMIGTTPSITRLHI